MVSELRVPISKLVPLVSPERATLVHRRNRSAHPMLWRWLDVVKDPEIPVLSLWDLGVLQDIEFNETDGAVVTITPTYSGCPAIETMRADIVKALREKGVAQVVVRMRLDPAWSTDWLTPATREALREYGIAPPVSAEEPDVCCPQCGSARVELISEFASTACKSIFRCRQCLEPFDHFKRH